ncbi:tetraacyldisaccharide 4'-kinase [Marinimicrobium sp. C2-29]|uniref:tetraacyldisaccharide 4'-kinase n=1 Tax=Marinimicrobium sp. C2-29 TaxID=3139825 RepID=UPI003138FC3C
MAQGAEAFWQGVWYGRSRWVYLLLPLTGLFRLLAAARRVWLEKRHQQQLSVPVIVVGNISVGGTGKTPLIISLAEHLQQRGYRPGIVSRGYGGRAPNYPLAVTPDTPVHHSGDEPLAIARATGCPVVVGPDRVAAGQRLCDQGCDLILSDDGLQHYRLARALEIAVVDGRRGFGNGHCLPAGPLREPVRRLQEVDWIVVNGAPDDALSERLSGLSPLSDSSNPTGPYRMSIQPRSWCPVSGGAPEPLSRFREGQSVHAVAGIGHPERFFTTLEQLQLTPIPHAFPDHHEYTPGQLDFDPPAPVVMTAKDAVKCQAFARPDWWYLSVSADLPDRFWQTLDTRLDLLKRDFSAEHQT